MTPLQFQIVCAVLPAAMALVATSILGAVGLGFAVGSLTPLAILVIGRSFKFHEGVVCIAGKHVSYLFMICSLILPRAMSGALGALVGFAAIAPESTFHALGVIPGAMVAMLGSEALGSLAKQTNNPKWKGYWDSLLALDRVASTEAYKSDLKDAIYRFDKNLGIMLDPEKIPEALSVAEFERTMCAVLDFRGAMVDGDGDIKSLLAERSFQDPDERRQWLEREINEEVWEDIQHAYASFAIEIIEKQSLMVADRIEG